MKRTKLNATEGVESLAKTKQELGSSASTKELCGNLLKTKKSPMLRNFQTKKCR